MTVPNTTPQIQAYERVRERMALGEISIEEVRERVQIALTLALANERGRGRYWVSELHARFAADAIAWCQRHTTPEVSL